MVIMVNQDRFKVDVEKLRSMQVQSLKTIKRIGEKHMKIFHKTMSAFKHPENRLKCHDTAYYEKVLPIVNEILRDYSNIKK